MAARRRRAQGSTLGTNPGIFKVTCAHAVAYGFHFMKEPESPSDLLTLLLTCWPRDMLLPALLWYGNLHVQGVQVHNQARALDAQVHARPGGQLSLRLCPARRPGTSAPSASTHMVAELIQLVVRARQRLPQRVQVGRLVPWAAAGPAVDCHAAVQVERQQARHERWSAS
jgi:hypothetical protein